MYEVLIVPSGIETPVDLIFASILEVLIVPSGIETSYLYFRKSFVKQY